MEKMGLVDLEPIKMMPTRRNNRLGNARVLKILNIFLVLENQSMEVEKIRT